MTEAPPFAVMGVVNITPDSFSDGGLYLAAEKAIEHGLRLRDEGAAILDLGGESTRPGAQPVPAEVERERVLPVIRGLAGRCAPASLSVDTSKATVAAAALAAGASMVNDVSALRGDPEMAGVIADAGADCCLMHMLGDPRTMQENPTYGDVVDEVKAFLEERASFAVRSGISEARIMLDPGIGFGKTTRHNLELLARLDEIAGLGCPVVIGTSRKAFLGRISGTAEPPLRLPETIASSVLAYERGASVLRVHDVAPVLAALRVAAATVSARWSPRTSPATSTS